MLSKQIYTEICLHFVNLMLMYRTMARQHNRATIRQLGEIGKVKQEVIYATAANVKPHRCR